MRQIVRCPLSGKECSKTIRVQEKTFFLAEPEKPEEDRERRRNVLDAALGNEYRIRSALEEKQYTFTCKICEMIQSCAYGIADIKTVNPNVLMELGMMIALSKPAIILCKKGEEGLKLPSDARAIGVIPFMEYADVIKPLREMAAKLLPSVSLPASVEDIEGILGEVKPSLAEEVRQVSDEYGDRLVIEFEEAAKEADLGTGISEREQVEISSGQGGRLDKIEASPEHLKKSGFTTDAGTALSRGNLYYERGEYELAVEHYDWAITLKPEFLEAWNSKGLALDGLNRYEEAINCYNKVIEIKPDDSNAWLNKVVALGNQRRYEEAVECCDKAIEVKPNDSNAWFNKGVALCNLDQYEEAIKCCDKAIEINPDFYEAWSNKSVILGNLGRYEEALECCDKVIGIKPDDNNAWFNKGVALINLGRPEEAIECYNKAIDVEPDDV